MKRFYSIICCLTIISGCFGIETTEHIKQPAIVEGQRPNNPLKALLALMGIEHDGTLADIVKKTQAAWLRRAGQERWDMENQYQDRTVEIVSLLGKIGVLKEIKPQHASYDYLLVMGAALPRMRERLKHAIDLANEGVHVDNVVLLAGQRPINPTIEPQETFYDRGNKDLPIRPDWVAPKEMPQTEYDAMRMIFDQAQLPEHWKNARMYVLNGNQEDPVIDYADKTTKIIFVNTPMQQVADGSERRPNTGDTVKTWLTSHPVMGSCLVMSNQPYVGYQHAVAQSLLPGFACETVGKASTTENIGVHLDNLARWLYQEHQNSK